MRQSARGFVLVVSLLVVTGLVTLTSVTMTRASTDLSASRLTIGQQRAFEVAEAGVDHAWRVLRASSLNWTDELRGADGIGATIDDGLLNFGPLVFLTPEGSYAVRVVDNADEPVGPNDPTTDVDGVIRIESAGTLGSHQRTVIVWLWSMFNFAVAAEQNIVSAESSFFGSIHANGDISVLEPSTIASGSRASASGVITGSLAGSTVSGAPRISFPRPDELALRASVTRWDPANPAGIITLLPDDLVGYWEHPSGQPDLSPNTVSLAAGASATLVIFDGKSITFQEKIGTVHPVTGYCVLPLVNLNIIALGGGAIKFEETACLQGLIWAEGSVSLGEKSTVSGAVISAAGSVSLAEKSAVTLNRDVFSASLLPGFAGASQLAWQEP